MDPKKVMLGLAIHFFVLVLDGGAASLGCASEPDGLDKAPVIRQKSKPVMHDNVEFEIVSDSVCPVPARKGRSLPNSNGPTGASPLRIQLRITNRRKEEMTFFSDAGTPLLRSSDGHEFTVQYWGQDHYFTPQRVTLGPGKSLTIDGSAHLYAYRNKEIRLWWEEATGTHWCSEPQKAGKYSLRLDYNSRKFAGEKSGDRQESAWPGDIHTAEVPVAFVELKESQPAVFSGVEAISRPDGTWQYKKATEQGWNDDLEITALASETWQAPAAGEETQVCLGFRMAPTGRSWVRVIPTITGINIKSAYGDQLPAKKTLAKVSVGEPQLLTLRPDYSSSVAVPATLFRSGKTLTLAWADGAGQVWHVENLKSGRYSIGLTIRAEKGRPSQYVSCWTGEIRTPTVMIDIKN